MTYRAEGTVTLDGNPLEDACILFHRDPPLPAAKGKMVPIPSAQSTEDGTFVVTTYKRGDGLPEGDYRVTITCFNKDKPVLNGYGDPVRGEFEELLPSHYADPKASTLAVTITKGNNELDEFRLAR